MIIYFNDCRANVSYEAQDDYEREQDRHTDGPNCCAICCGPLPDELPFGVDGTGICRGC